MKKQFLLAIACIMFTGSLMAFDVTFSVDMTGAPAFTTPEVNGNFNVWAVLAKWQLSVGLSAIPQLN